jgi:hypothetical protein
LRFEGEAETPSQPVYRGRLASPTIGKGLAFKLGGDVMWYLPLSFTLEMKKTRTSWYLVIRVHFIHQEREGGRKLILLLQAQYMIFVVFPRVS